MSSDFHFRLVEPTDAKALLHIYETYVLGAAITFEYEVPSLDEYLSRIQTNTTLYPWIVCEFQGRLVGYAYGSTHRYRTAYQWSPEATIYIHEDFHGKGIASVLYDTLFKLLALQGYVNVFAGVLIPNPKSEFFHKKMGFQEIGIFKNIGYKLGAWQSTKWFQLDLKPHELNPPNPIPTKEIFDSVAYQDIIRMANELFVLKK